MGIDQFWIDWNQEEISSRPVGKSWIEELTPTEKAQLGIPNLGPATPPEEIPAESSRRRRWRPSLGRKRPETEVVAIPAANDEGRWVELEKAAWRRGSIPPSWEYFFTFGAILDRDEGVIHHHEGWGWLSWKACIPLLLIPIVGWLLIPVVVGIKIFVSRTAGEIKLADADIDMDEYSAFTGRALVTFKTPDHDVERLWFHARGKVRIEKVGPFRVDKPTFEFVEELQKVVEEQKSQRGKEKQQEEAGVIAGAIRALLNNGFGRKVFGE